MAPIVFAGLDATVNEGETFSSPAAPTSGLVSWWPFDESGGTTAADIVDNHPGTLFNSPAFAPGLFGNALFFDGANRGVDLGNSASLNPTNFFTISVWVKPDNFADHGEALASFWPTGGTAVGGPGSQGLLLPAR